MSMDAYESTVANKVRLAVASLKKCILFRNNVGKLPDVTGRWVEFGLCVGSSDYIGWNKYVITAEDVGKTIAVFTAVETKRPKNAKVKEAQENFIERVNQAGGIAGRVNNPDAAIDLIQNWRPRS